jgi:hypothetical protein
MKALRTNTGFVVLAAAGQGAQFYSVPVFSKLYLQLVNNDPVTKTWEWKRAAMQAAVKTLSVSRTFFKDQLFSGEAMNPRGVDFLYSTFTFIMSGKRQLAAPLWTSLLEYHPKELSPVSDKIKDRFGAEFRPLLILNDEQVISMWMSQPGGLEDMVASMYIIFADLPTNWQSL